MNTGLVRQHTPQLEAVPPPEDLTPSEIKYALNVIQGYTQSEAYLNAFGNKCRGMSPSQVSRAAYKLKVKAAVQSYIRALVQELEQAAVATALDLQVFLTAAVFTPISQIDENSPLCQKKKTRVITTKDGGCVESVELETINKLEAARTLIRMKGLDAPIKVDHTIRGGIMVVPMAANVEDWEAMAVKSQQALMDDASNI